MPLSNKEKSSKGGKATQEKWDSTKELALAGKLDEIDSDIFIKHYQTLKRIKVDYGKLPDDLPGTCGVWYYGTTGTGKSRTAREEYPDAYMKLPNKWWDGYQNQDSVIIDDFDKNHACLGYHLKIWADRYAFSAEVKGSTVMIRPKTLIITSNYHPKEIWGDSNNTLEPILRRFKITQFKDIFHMDPPSVTTDLMSLADNFKLI